MKRIPKSIPPEHIGEMNQATSFTQFAEVYVPNAPRLFTYGVRNSAIRRGSVVWVSLGKRKAELALVARITTDRPKFETKEAVLHISGYTFSERWMETLEWCARYYVSTPPRALRAFWPTDFPKYLDALVATQSDCLDSAPLNNELSNAKCSNDASAELPPLTEEQTVTINQLSELMETNHFQGALLHGVTGSGKTRIYQEIVAKTIAQGKRALILVPEIGLTPQNAKRFSDFLKCKITVLHSSLSVPAKRNAWLSILNGSAQVLLGTRSAILTPFPFDTIILDEEHDASFKQQDPAPRYHCRELAFHIAYKHNGLVILGSATPSFESFHYAQTGKLHYLQLKNRATNVALPQVQIIDMKKEMQQSDILLSATLRDALSETIQNGNQAIILMNRRGYSKLKICQKCGATFFCKHCRIPLVYHKQHNMLLCHYCGALYSLSEPCMECHSPNYDLVGGAIEKLEEEIREWIPGAKAIRMDKDTTQNIGAIERILNSFRAGEFNILLGTQMVAKGHDFPKVQLVGIVGAETGYGIPDFRGSERLFQLLSQTAGRAGRARDGARVILQTLRPEEPVIQFTTEHAYLKFAEQELKERQVALYPPFRKLAIIELGSKDEELLKKTAAQFARRMDFVRGLQVLGPTEAFVAVVKNVHRLQFFLKAKESKIIRNALTPFIDNPRLLPKNIEIRFDIDP